MLVLNGWTILYLLGDNISILTYVFVPKLLQKKYEIADNKTEDGTNT